MILKGRGGRPFGFQGYSAAEHQCLGFVQAALFLDEATAASMKAMPATPSSMFGKS